MVRYSFRKTIPVMFGYLFLGFAFGLLLQQSGYNGIWAFFTSLVIFAGSAQFVLVGLLAARASLLTVAAIVLFINSRHIFYGLSFLTKFKEMGNKYPYMVFALTDETYSLLSSCVCPTDMDEKKVMFYISFFNHCYWIAGSVAGAMIGQLIPFDFAGIEFSMTALFVVIFIEQWKESKSHIPAITGLLSGTLLLIFTGSSNFIMPSLIVTVLALVSAKPLMERNDGKGQTA